MVVLVIDVGGSHVKVCVSPHPHIRRFNSGAELTPQALVEQVSAHTSDWRYDVISIGFPGITGAKGPEAEPGNLGNGWIGFDFERALGKPVRLVNDAVMQALGAYDGGRMIFLDWVPAWGPQWSPNMSSFRSSSGTCLCEAARRWRSGSVPRV